MARDMTENQFRAALERHGINPNRGPLGYHQVTGYQEGDPGGLRVCALNAGRRRRDQLAYLIRCRERELELTAKANENRKRLTDLIGEAQVGPPYYTVGPKGVRLARMDLSVEDAAAVITLLRELRSNGGR